ncbi:PHP domain-containing protein [Candidatus Woesearchaeota archaeon]|nr:PHP domain-containing protein [Candidatus Woesearchaeota archaeon]
MKLEMHVHTDYSRDCLLSVEALRKECQKKGVVPCITDHDTIRGALEYRRRYGKRSCIVGEEIMTSNGEVIAYFLTREVPAGLDFWETVKRIRKQGAIVALPHPFDRMRKHSRLKENKDSLRSLFSKGAFDMIETFNSRTVLSRFNDAAEEFYREIFKASKGRGGMKRVYPFVGSDAHTRPEVGRSYVQVPDFDVTNKEKFMQSFKRKKPILVKRKSTILVHVVTKTVKIFRLNRLLKGSR